MIDRQTNRRHKHFSTLLESVKKEVRQLLIVFRSYFHLFEINKSRFCFIKFDVTSNESGLKTFFYKMKILATDFVIKMKQHKLISCTISQGFKQRTYRKIIFLTFSLPLRNKILKNNKKQFCERNWISTFCSKIFQTFL